MARTVTDVARLLTVIAGADPKDPMSIDVYNHYPASQRTESASYADFTQFLKKGSLKGARLGVVGDFFGGDSEIDALANTAIAKMQELGAHVVAVRLQPAFVDFYIRNATQNIRRIADYRFKHDWETYLTRFGPRVPRTVAEFVEIYETRVARSALPVEDVVLDLLKRSLVTSTDDAAYQNLITNVLPTATKLKLAIFETFEVDALVFPYQPTFAPPIANPVSHIDDPTYVAARDRLDPATFAGYSSVGFPGIVVPMGRGSQGLPIAISFMGRPYDEGRLISYAYDYEQGTLLRRPSPLVPPLPGEAITYHAPKRTR
jgi:amidase